MNDHNARQNDPAGHDASPPGRLVATLIAATPPEPGNTGLDEVLAGRLAETLASGPGGARITWLAPAEALDIELPQGMTRAAAHGKLTPHLEGLPVDLVIQEEATRRKRILVADMDSTMIDQECIDELAAEIGLKEQVAEITARAMNGEIEFEPALRERVALLAGLPASIIDTIIDKRITLASGGHALIATMKAHGGHTVLVSGGFTVFTTRIAAMLGFDENHANILEIEAGHLNGKVREPILGKEAKVATLDATAERLGFHRGDCIAVGDGANDLAMLSVAGTGIALHAKPSVAASAPHRVDHGDLTALLYLQGYRRDEFVNP